MKRAERILKNIFGFDDFRLLQKDIINSVLQNNDTLAIMPTGGGKSLCYQIPALIFDGITIVVSPLISLMKDQVEQLNEYGIGAVYLNSSLPKREYARNIEMVDSGVVKIIYLAPETLMLDWVIEWLSKNDRVSFFTVDEAHCISEWGHDFRPEYRKLKELRKVFSDIPWLALTATATPSVRDDIKTALALRKSKLFVSSFDRENLFLEVQIKTKGFEQLVKFIEKFRNESGIIYCFSRKITEALAEKLKKKGFKALPYHAGLTNELRDKHQQKFACDDVNIIVATVAFGMGINKPDVRYVVHYNLPKNLESYYQEIGRAGRDGLPSHCFLLLSYADISKIKYIIDNKKYESDRRIASIHLNTMLQYAESKSCRRKIIMTYFGEKYEIENCENCDNCVSAIKREKEDYTIEAQKILSCIKRTGEIFGMGYVIDVLRGSNSERILNNRHNLLSTYGIGHDYSKKAWSQFVRQLLHDDVVFQDTKYGSLKLRPKAWKILRGEEKFFGFMDRENHKEKKKSNRKIDMEYDADLFAALRLKRKELADAHNVAPYMIFPDKTLMALAAEKPKTMDDMRHIYGIGDKKFKTYAAYFFKIINGE